ncbi:MAG: ATP-dependent sacrificial sulfur transferase LarE [Coriobacteriia bacterium]|nr:ATP-dependent sacrificial sulfur transferase LarE [Coriobacteriia bacterium]MCL2537768.1 ATP-dependent sacrificial sulfur transferase LarE [Coriobacteriia bacterium]
MAQLEQQAAALRQRIAQLDSAVLAFSGGVDSSLLAALGSEILGDKFIALTMRSPLMTAEELAECAHFCTSYGIAHQFLDLDILSNPDFIRNDALRCYYCKRDIFTQLKSFAVTQGFAQIMDGSNSDDDPSRRPGMRVLTEQGIVSPLREEGFTKDQIRQLSRQMGLSTWDKQSDSCLATRVASGTLLSLDTIATQATRAATSHNGHHDRKDDNR